MAKFPAIPSTFLEPEQPILDPSGKEIAKLVDFWQWAYSDLIGNTERGILAEYLVACALGIQDHVRISWDKYDLLFGNIKIEVKSSGYIQTWDQEKLSQISFGIAKTEGWNHTTNVIEEVKKRQADVYIFCVHKHTDQQTINPLDTSQWEFYVLQTKQLDEKARDRKTISLQSLLQYGAKKYTYETLITALKY